jgi:type I restriction enzyme M protein
MDASQYKDYVLALLFVKYVSDKYVGQPMRLSKWHKAAALQTCKRLKAA